MDKQERFNTRLVAQHLYTQVCVIIVQLPILKNAVSLGTATRGQTVLQYLTVPQSYSITLS